MTSWREALSEAGVDWSDVVSCTLAPCEMDRQFDDGYGGANGAPFTLWTSARVYFPVVYDGAEWVGSVPRDPCAEATAHIGGG